MSLKLEGYKLYYHNGVYMGEVMQDTDGFYKFWPDKERYGGYWDEGVLLELAQLLTYKNTHWQKQIEEWFGEASSNP